MFLGLNDLGLGDPSSEPTTPQETRDHLVEIFSMTSSDVNSCPARWTTIPSRMAPLADVDEEGNMVLARLRQFLSELQGHELPNSHVVNVIGMGMTTSSEWAPPTTPQPLFETLAAANASISVAGFHLFGCSITPPVAAGGSGPISILGLDLNVPYDPVTDPFSIPCGCGVPLSEHTALEEDLSWWADSQSDDEGRYEILEYCTCAMNTFACTYREAEASASGTAAYVDAADELVAELAEELDLTLKL